MPKVIIQVADNKISALLQQLIADKIAFSVQPDAEKQVVERPIVPTEIADKPVVAGKPHNVIIKQTEAKPIPTGSKRRGVLVRDFIDETMLSSERVKHKDLVRAIQAKFPELGTNAALSYLYRAQENKVIKKTIDQGVAYYELV